MAITGKVNPEMENEITPHKEAALMDNRMLPNSPNRKTPNACEASTRSSPASIIGKMPLLHGKCMNPYR